jgi:3-isopropylmalate/(R)-2-methylmalate dehydratase large subunit
MGKTIVEKILARASGRNEVSVGEYIQVTSDRPTKLRGESAGKGSVRYRDLKKIAKPHLIKIVDGHSGVGGGNKKIGDVRVVIRQWAKEVGIPPENIINLGRAGVEHVYSGEQCWPLPGSVYFSVTNGHTSSLGALGAFAVSLSYETGAYIVTGTSWAQVPETTKLEITGSLSKGVTARDVCEYVIGRLGPTGTPGHVMEWTGPAIDAMDMDARFTICNNAIFTGAWTAVINPDTTTLNYVKSCTNEPFEPMVSDPDAGYVQTFRFDISELEPLVIPPPNRTDVFPVSQYQGTKIDYGFIGSCANGRLEDMRMAAKILKGRQIPSHVVLNITPASMNVYKQCIREGILEIFADAGACIATPCCGMCASGSNTPLGAGNVCISTGTCNYPGRMGSSKAHIYLGSPATVAASAVTGEITDPRNFL